MKKKNILFLFLALMLVFTVYPKNTAFLSAEPAQEEQAKTDTLKQVPQYEVVIRTYYLKFIRPIEILNAAKFYIIDSTAYGDTITVKIFKRNIPKFEEILKKLDVEKKTVLFKVFTVLASKEQEPKEEEVIENRDLKEVLDELKNLWNFKSYKIDGPSFLTVKEESGSNNFRLVSRISYFNLNIFHVKVRGEKPGKRVVSIGHLQLTQTPPFQKEKSTLIDTHELTLKEKGYLVAGVSGFSFTKGMGEALILVISAEIK